MPKKGHKLKTSPLIKNSQFLSNLANIQVRLTTHEVVILIKFHQDCKTIVGFLLTKKFLVCAFFYALPCKARCAGHFLIRWHICDKDTSTVKPGFKSVPPLFILNLPLFFCTS